MDNRLGPCGLLSTDDPVRDQQIADAEAFDESDGTAEELMDDELFDETQCAECLARTKAELIKVNGWADLDMIAEECDICRGR